MQGNLTNPHLNKYEPHSPPEMKYSVHTSVFFDDWCNNKYSRPHYLVRNFYTIYLVTQLYLSSFFSKQVMRPLYLFTGPPKP